MPPADWPAMVAAWRASEAKRMRAHAERIRAAYTARPIADLTHPYAEDLERAALIVDPPPRSLAEELAEMERRDPAIAAAAANLDRVVAGIVSRPSPASHVCPWCDQPTTVDEHGNARWHGGDGSTACDYRGTTTRSPSVTAIRSALREDLPAIAEMMHEAACICADAFSVGCSLRDHRTHGGAIYARLYALAYADSLAKDGG